jgi:hypothetical protein
MDSKTTVIIEKCEAEKKKDVRDAVIFVPTSHYETDTTNEVVFRNLLIFYMIFIFYISDQNTRIVVRFCKSE